MTSHSSRVAHRTRWMAHFPTLSIFWIAWYFAANVLLAVLSQRFAAISTAWALAALVVGVAVLGQRRAREATALVTAYIVGAELIWRGTGARIFWEYGKYSVIVLLALVLLTRVSGRKLEWRALAYFGLLLVSLLVLPDFDRESVAFNLSGPIALVACIVFFNGRMISRALLVRLAVTCLGPIVALAALASWGTFAADPQEFEVGQKVTTAGIGPNQVSSILGLGMLLVFILLVIGPRRKIYRLFLGAVGIWLTVQTLLSFSRGGFWGAIGAILVVAVLMARTPRVRVTLLTIAAIGVMIFQLAIIPVTDRFTGGMVRARFSEADLTGREKIMKADWEIFLENPLFGVGPGQSYEAHARTFRPSSAHTEFTRLLAEHGVFGLTALGLLVWMTLTWWRRDLPPLSKALSMGFTAWALLNMMHSAMRLAAPAYFFGLGAALLLADDTALSRWVEPRLTRADPTRYRRVER